MKYIFNFPDIGEGLDEGTILEVYVKVGQTIKSGDILVNMETDKVTTDIPSPKSGTILKIFGDVGDTIDVGSPLVEIEIEGSEADAAASTSGSKQAEEEEEAAGVVGTLEIAGSDAILPSSDESYTSAGSITLSKSLAVPKVRGLAKELNIDINKVAGTGKDGRVTQSDLTQFASKKEEFVQRDYGQRDFAQDYDLEDVTFEPLTQIRKSIARNMIQSKHNAAHVSVFEEVEVSDLMAIREQMKQNYADRGAKLTYLPFIVKATVLALKKYRLLNSRIEMEQNRMVFFDRYNIGIAMDTPEGLVVPVIKDADRLSIFELTQKITEFSIKAQERKLTMADMKGGTFTISNFGSIAGIFGTPVLNYPQAGILGVGRIVKQPVVKNDQVVPGNVLGLSLTVDHRIVDGGETARFVRQIMDYLGDPFSLLLE